MSKRVVQEDILGAGATSTVRYHPAFGVKTSNDRTLPWDYRIINLPALLQLLFLFNASSGKQLAQQTISSGEEILRATPTLLPCPPNANWLSSQQIK
jgi:hypothetical protein